MHEHDSANYNVCIVDSQLAHSDAAGRRFVAEYLRAQVNLDKRYVDLTVCD